MTPEIDNLPPVTSQFGGTLARPVLQAAAFGAGVPQWPLPAASTPHELWLRAVAAGGQGHYASAHADLAALRRQFRPECASEPSEPGPQALGSLGSLAHSTAGSLMRQLGWHDVARRWDGIALRLAGADVQARGDALVGLAADALGVGRFTTSAALLAGARQVCGGPARQEVRLEWVSAELAMMSGDGVGAVRHARRAIDLAAAVSSVRHQIKSEVVLAAALCSAGQLNEARAVADPALMAAERSGLVPLRWAVASLLSGIGSAGRTAEEIAAARDEAADLIKHRGGVFAR